MIVYQRINGADWRNIWVVGDLHGCHSLLMEKLNSIGFDTKLDLLVSVGDLIDRGEENVECLELLTRPWFRAVRGNHEQMMLEHLLYDGGIYPWLRNGGCWYADLDSLHRNSLNALLPEVEVLPLIIEVVSDGKKTVICHADYSADSYAFDKSVNTEDVIWSRDRIEALLNGEVKPISGADQFIFGHTPLKTPLQFANQHYIDTGAVFTGNLTLLQIQGGRLQL